MSEIFLATLCALFYLAIKLSESKPNKVQYYCKWYSYYLYGLLVCTICCCLYLWRGRDIRNLPRVAKWLWPMTKFNGVTWHLENAEVMDKCGKAVIISNHQSSLDIIGVVYASSTIKNLIPTCKKEMIYLGPIGLIFYLIGSIIIDRRNSREAYKQLDRAAEIITKKAYKIWMFPEGTRNIQRKVKLLPFKKGAFATAVATQSPIIPVVFSPYYFAYENKHVFQNGGHIIMRCLEPVSTSGLTMDDVPALTERLQNVVLKAYEELSEEVMQKFPGAATAQNFKK